MRITKEIENFKYNEVKPYKINNNTTEKTLEHLGISADAMAIGELKNMINQSSSYAMDEMITVPNISNLVQFFQYWYPEIIEVLTSARKIDEIVGRTIAGNWEDEEIVSIILERTGNPKLYGDHTNVPLTSWNENFVRRNIVRVELGCEVGILESLRSAKMKIDTTNEKKTAVAEAMAILINKVGFFGFNNGENKTYGLLNDPNLLDYTTLPVGAGGYTKWNTKTFTEILNDILLAIQTLTTQAKGLFDSKKDSFQLVIPDSVEIYLDQPNSLGTDSIYSYLKRTYPNIRVVSCPEFENAENGSNVMYIITDTLNGKETIKQFVPEVFRLLGVEKKAKANLEDYSSASAGVLVRYPVGVVRYIGL